MNINSSERFVYLLKRYVEDKIPYDGERDELFDMIASGKYDELLSAMMEKELRMAIPEDSFIPLAISKSIVKNALRSEKAPGGWVSRNLRFIYWLAAACLLCAFGFSLSWYQQKKAFEDLFSVAWSGKLDQVSNDSRKPEDISLPDGSHVLLSSGSAIAYEKFNFKKNRVVYLGGEGRFYVTKDPTSPFYVYYRHVVTKVLGTSFRVGANRSTGDVEVEVLTGKVRVFKNGLAADTGSPDGVSLTANQKAVYSPASKCFEIKLADQPMPVIDNEHLKAGLKEAPERFVFENAKMSEVVRSLEKGYGIEMILKDRSLYNCLFSGDITKEDLYNKLKVICIATNSEYQVDGTRILIQKNQ